MVALGTGVACMRGADLKDFGKDRGVGFGGIAKFGPIHPVSALDDVVDRGQGQALGLDVAVIHPCEKLYHHGAKTRLERGWRGPGAERPRSG